MSKTLWYSWSGLLQSFSLLWNRGCPSELSTLPLSLVPAVLKGQVLLLAKTAHYLLFAIWEGKRTVSPYQGSLWNLPWGHCVCRAAGAVILCWLILLSNQIQTALWSLLEGKDSSRLCSLGASWNPVSTHNFLCLSSQMERCSLRTQRLYQKFHCIVMLCL